MDLIDRLRAWALASPRVLVVDAPGGRALRWTAEAELDRRGWAQALSPSDADLLLVIGAPGPELTAAVELVWRQMSRPRHRVDLLSEDDLEECLDDAVASLVHSRHEATAPGTGSDPSEHGEMEQSADGGMDHSGMDHSGMDHSGMEPSAGGGMDHSGMEPSAGGGMDHSADSGMDHSGMEPSADSGMDHSADSGMDHSGMEPSADSGMDHSADSGMDHSGMGGMDHSGHQMHHGGEVAGLPMAETGPDRDGLSLDVLRVSLGPILPAWPTGLLLRAELQGDVLTGATLSWLDTGNPADADRDADPRRTALDHLASLLEVAGWSTAARDARRARDGLTSPDPAERGAAEHLAQRVAGRVRRSRALAWSLRGIGHLDGRHPGSDGDVLDRVRRWCDVATDGAAPVPGVLPLDVVAAALRGAEVAAARLIVASVELQRSVLRVEPEVVGA